MLVSISEGGAGDLICQLHKVESATYKDGKLTVHGEMYSKDIDVTKRTCLSMFKEDDYEELRYYLVNKKGYVTQFYNYAYSESAGKAVSVDKQVYRFGKPDEMENVYSIYFTNH